MPVIERLRASQLASVGRLLTDSGLPADDYQHPDNRFYGLFEQGHLVACGGLQITGSAALLRSLVVQPSHRGKGMGRQLVEHLLCEADAEGCSAVYLLTETSRAYFTGLGFCLMERSQVPSGIATTAQFASLCPDSADCLMKELIDPSTGDDTCR